MSTLKVDGIRSNSASSDAITLASDGTCTANITNRSNRNLIINGEFIIDQRMGGSATAITPSGGVDYTCDRWHQSNYGGEAGRITYQTVSGDVPNGNYRQAIKLDCTTAMGTPSGNNWMGFCQFIESQDIRFLGHGTSAAKSITLQFWIKSTKTGTATVQLLRHDASREYLAEYTINASDTWEKKTITIPGDTSGTEAAFDNGRGFKLCFVLFAGSSRHGTVNTWRAQNGGYFGASANQVNLLDNTSNNILFTGVQLEVGSVATDFEHRSFGQELDLCMRYFQRFVSGNNSQIGMGAYYTSSQLKCIVPFIKEMRTGPSVIQETGTNYYVFYRDGNADTFDSFGVEVTDERKTCLNNSSQVSGTVGYGGIVRTYNASARLDLNAEL